MSTRQRTASGAEHAQSMEPSPESTASSRSRSRRRSSSSKKSEISDTSSKADGSKVMGKKRHKEKAVISLETIIYAVHLIFFFFYVVPIYGGTVKTKCEGYLGCSRFIRPTVLGYSVDLADGQWRDMRGNFPLLWATLFLTTAGHWFCSKFWKNMRKPGSPTLIGELATVSAVFRLVVGAIFLYVLHGRHSLIVLFLAYVGYRVTQWQIEAGSVSRWYSWVFAVIILLFKESYRLQHLPSLAFLRPIFDHARYGGMYRWQLPANFLILRILSYSLDFLAAAKEENTAVALREKRRSWKSKQLRSRSRSKGRGAGGSSSSSSSTEGEGGEGSSAAASEEEEEEDEAPDSTPKKKTKTKTKMADVVLTQEALSNASRPMSDYNIVNYLSYVFYTPLYTAGPIITFNAFVENTYHPQKSEDPYRYAGRWLMCMVCMELLSNRFPFFAVIQSGLFPYLSPAEMAITAYFTLKMMWLKFLLTWRFFRLWALADGTLAPENMLRCMSNNCSLEQFWRGWHASFNRWIVRYMYMPLGGRDSRVYSVWLIFLFVAIWHDIELKLLVWGLLNGVFFVVEIMAKRSMKSDLMRSLPSSLLQAILVLSGATYILVLVGVNLTGYAIGVSGVQTVLNKFVTWEGFVTLLAAYYFLCLAVSFMNFLKRVGWTNAP